MKKLMIGLGCMILIVLSMVVVAEYKDYSLEEKCKAYGDFVDNKPYDLELVAIGEGRTSIYCFDPVEERHYEVTNGAIDIVMMG